jgi:hypothetical protein
MPTLFEAYGLEDAPKPAAPPPEPEQAGVGRTLADVAIKGAQGVVGLGQSAVGLGNIATGGLVGKGMQAIGYDPDQTNAVMGEFLSDSQKRSDKAVEDATGFVDTTIAAVKNPRFILGSLAQSAPGILAMGAAESAVAARIAAKAALGTAEGATAAAGLTGTKAIDAALATKAGNEAASAAVNAAAGRLVGVGAVAEGAQAAGQIADQAQRAGRSYTDYALPAIAAGVGDAAISFGTGKLLGDAATEVFTGAKQSALAGSRPVRALKAAGSEFTQETLQSGQEQAFTNVAMGEQDIWKGVPEAAAQGGVTGAALGGALGLGSKPHAQAKREIEAQYADQLDTAKRMREGGDAAAADMVERNVAKKIGGELSTFELGRMSEAAPDADFHQNPVFQAQYQSMRQSGTTPAEAAARAAAVSKFWELGRAGGLSDKAITAAVEVARDQPMDRMGEFLGKYADSLKAKGIGQVGNIAPDLDGASEEAMTAVANGIYGRAASEDQTNAVLDRMDKQAQRELAAQRDFSPEPQGVQDASTSLPVQPVAAGADGIGSADASSGVVDRVGIAGQRDAGLDATSTEGAAAAVPARVDAAGQPSGALENSRVVGSDAGNGFKHGPQNGERYRVGVVDSVGGAIAIEKRYPAGTAGTFYVGKDGNLIDGDSINLIGNGKEKLWIPETPEQAKQAQQILDEMGQLDLQDPARKGAKERLKQVVSGRSNEASVPVDATDQPAAVAAQPAGQEQPANVSPEAQNIDTSAEPVAQAAEIEQVAPQVSSTGEANARGTRTLQTREEIANLHGLDRNESALQQPEERQFQELRRQGDQGLQGMGAQLPDVSFADGAAPKQELPTRSNQQPIGVRADELPVGGNSPATKEQEVKPALNAQQSDADSSGMGRAIGDETANSTDAIATRMERENGNRDTNKGSIQQVAQAPGETPAPHAWDSFGQEQRADTLKKAGWSTAKGELNLVGKKLAAKPWADIVPATRATIERFMPEQTDQKRAKALDRIARGTAFFAKESKAGQYLVDNGLSDTHEVVRHASGANRWDVVAKPIIQNQKQAESAPNGRQALSTSEQKDNETPVSSQFTGQPDPRNSPPMQALDGYAVGDTVDIPARTFGSSKIEVLYQRKMAGFDEPGSMARVVRADGKRLDVLTSELKKEDEGKHDDLMDDAEMRSYEQRAGKTPISNVVQAAKDSGKLQIINVGDKPAPVSRVTVDKAEIRPYRKPDGSVGYKAIPIVDDKLSTAEQAAKEKMLSAAADLANLLGKNFRANITPEQEQKLLPIVIRLFEGAMELGHVKFKQAARYVRDFIANAIDKEAADAIPIDTLQGAYIATARRHADKAVTPKAEVVAVESLDELEEPAEVAPASMTVEFGGKTYPVASIEDAQDKWDQFREKANQEGSGSADIGNGVIVKNSDGTEVGRISYNGRFWPAETAPAAKTDAGEITPTAAKQKSTDAKQRSGAEGETPAADAAKAGKIDDFGEKLEGARKDYAATLKDALAVDVATEPLSKSWPEPDYQKLLDGGADPFVVAWVHASRDEIPTKPQRAWKIKNWAEQVKLLRDMSSKLLDGQITKTALQEKLARSEFEAVRNAVGGRADLYQAVGHEKSLKGVTLKLNHYTFYKGVQHPYPGMKMWAVEQQAKATAFGNWPHEIATGEDREKVIEAFKAKYADLQTGPKKRTGAASFVIYRKRGEPGAFVGKKIGREYIDLHKAEDLKAARDYLDKNTEALETALEKYKETPYERNTENAPRVGGDHRNGAPVTPEIFSDTFGFRGVQFGNYVEQGRRQSDLNQAFDALMDMAAVLDLPPRALSLNGRLGLAFGARGKGGKNAPAAHYEPGTVVINLTKGGGPGSLAHEWFHSMDNYFAKEGGTAGFMTESARGDALREEMRAAFKAIKQEVNAGAYKKRAQELDKRKSKPYWATPVEMSARAFESYIIAKLQDQSAANDYLANIVSEQAWNTQEAIRAEFFTGKKAEPSYPYPTADEIPAIRAAFDEFFKTVQTKEDDAGNVAMFSRKASAEEQNALKTLSEIDELYALPKSDKTTVADITADNDPEIKVTESKQTGQQVYTFTMPDGVKATMTVRPYNKYGKSVYSFDMKDGEPVNQTTERPGENAEEAEGKDDVWIDVSKLSRGEYGTKIYNIAATYAHNTGKIFIGDPAGLSVTALRRRLENMISNALKFGTTEHLAPHPDQVTGGHGVPALKWVYGDDVGNIERMIDASVAATDNVFPTAKNIGYDPDAGTFVNTVTGRPVPSGRLSAVLRSSIRPADASNRGSEGTRREGASASEAGWRTLARRAVFASLLEIPGRPGRGRGILEGLVRQRDQLVSPTTGERIFYSKGAGSNNGLTADQFKTGLSNAFGKTVADRLLEKGVVIPLEDQSKLPEHVVPFLRNGDVVYGFHDPKTDRTYAVLSNLTPEMVKPLTLHEVGVHYGFEAMLGKAKYAAVMHRLDMMEKRGQKDVVAAAKNARDNAANPRQIPEERLAYLVKNNPEMGVVREIIAAIKAFLFREFGIGEKYLTADDMTALAKAAVMHASRTQDGGSFVPAFSRKTDQTDTPAFKAWFGDSKVIDGSGNPLAVYHGTRSDISQFHGNRFYFTADPSYASGYADTSTSSGYANDGANVMPVYLALQNPLDLTSLGTGRLSEQSVLNAMAANGVDVDGLRGLVRNKNGGDIGVWAWWHNASVRDAVQKAGFDSALQMEQTGAGKTRAYIAFKPEQIKSAIGNNGDFSPTNPDIRFSRAADATVAQEPYTFANRARDLFHDVADKQTTFNWWNNTIGTQYQKAQQDKHFKRVFDATQDYILDVSRLANQSADLARDLLPKLENFSDVLKHTSTADVQAIAKPVFQGTLSEKRVYKPEELKRVFGLTDKQAELYKQFRQAVDKSIDDLSTTTAAKLMRYAGFPINMLQDEIEAGDHRELARMAAEVAKEDPKVKGLADQIKDISDRAQTLKAEAYAPLMRFGQYAVSVRDPLTKELKQFYLLESQAAANKKARLVAGAGVVEQSVMSTKDYELLKGVSPESLELFGDILEKAGMFDTRDELFQTYLRRAIDQRSAMKRMIERHGYPGYSEDMRRVLATFVTSNARLASKNLHFSNMLEAAENIPKEKGDVRDEATALVKYVQEPVEEAPKIRGLLFANYLGGLVASALTNMTQTITMTVPYLSQFSSPLKAGAALAKGMKQSVTEITDKDLANALAKAEQDGLVSPQEIHHLNAEAMGTFGSHPAVQKAMFLWGSLFSLAEQFNRKSTFIAAYNMARELGKRDPYAFAQQAVEETQGIYNRGNRPDWARGAIGATVFTFKQFSISYLEFLSRLPAREKVLALAILMLAAGGEGLPFADDLDDIIDTIAQKLGYNFNSKKKKREFIGSVLGQGGADFVLKGMSAIPGLPIDVSGRMGMANLIPGSGVMRKDAKDHMADALEVLGPAGGFMRDTVNKTWLPTTAAELSNSAFTPVAIRNLAKSADMFQTGMYRDTKGRKVIDTTAADAIWKAVGFQPAEVAKESQRARIVQQGVSMAKISEAEIADQMAQARFEGSIERYREAREKMEEWNRKNPESRMSISTDQVARRVKEMKMDREQRIIKSAPRELRGNVKAQLVQ